MDKLQLAKEIYSVSHLTGNFTLRSGKVSTEYFDKYLFESNPRLLKEIAEHMSHMIPEGTEILAGLELGGVPLATAISLNTGLPVVFVRKKAKEYGTSKLSEGTEINGKNVCVIEDVTTTGGQIIESTKELRKLGANVHSVMCAVIRDDSVVTNLSNEELKLSYLFHIRELE